jgi:hypothetical protein
MGLNMSEKDIYINRRDGMEIFRSILHRNIT